MASSSSLKETLGSLFWGAVMFGVGVWMIVQPKVEWLDGEGPSRAKSQFIYSILKWIWGMPGGIVLVLLGGLLLFSVLKPKKPEPADGPGPA